MPLGIEAATFTIDPSGTIQRRIWPKNNTVFNQPMIANRVEMEVGAFVPVKNQDTIVFFSSSQGFVFALIIEESGIFPSRSSYIKNIEKIPKWNVWNHEVGYNHWKWQTCHPLCPYQLSITVSYLESLQNLSRSDALFAVWSFCLSLEESTLPAFGGFKHRLRWFQLPPELNLCKKNWGELSSAFHRFDFLDGLCFTGSIFWTVANC